MQERPIRKNRPSSFVSSVEMGGMDGVSMARVVRQEDEHVQIVFISGYADYIAEGYEVSALPCVGFVIVADRYFIGHTNPS